MSWGSRETAESPYMRSSKSLEKNLAGAQELRKNAESILQGLRELKLGASEREGVAVKIAHKKLLEIRESLLSYLNHKKVLSERLGVRAENLSSIAEIFGPLLLELEQIRAELPAEIDNFKSMPSRRHSGGEVKNGASPKLGERTVHQESNERGEVEDVMRNLVSVLCVKSEGCSGNTPAGIEAIAARIGSNIEQSEQEYSVSFLRRDSLQAIESNLTDEQRDVHQMKESLNRERMNFTRAAAFELSTKNSELLHAKDSLESLKADLLAVQAKIADFDSARTGSGEIGSVIAGTQQLLEKLGSAESSEIQRRLFCSEMENIARKLRTTEKLQALRGQTDGETQTSISGAQLRNAIITHAANLDEERNRQRSSKRSQTSRAKKSRGSSQKKAE